MRLNDTYKFLMQLQQTQLALRSAEFLHRVTFKTRYKRMAEAIFRFNKCRHKKPKAQIDGEIKLCKKYWGCYPLHYYRYNLYREDMQLSEQELVNYIPEFFFYYLFLPYFDSKKHEILLTDKNITEKLFECLSISQPPTISILLNNQLYTSKMTKISFISIEQEIRRKDYKKIFVKPLSGSGGYGIFIFNQTDTRSYQTKNHETLNEEFLRKIGSKDDYIIQPGIKQERQLSMLYPHSINTFRIATENRNGKAHVLCATLRMGRGGIEVDNSAQDGLIVGIDLKTGEITHHATSEKGEYFKSHPDTNYVFSGKRISNFNRIRDFVIESANKLPQFTFLGWDIALAEKGPIAIEANRNFGLDHYQAIMGGLREVFGITEPQFYWKNKGKRA